VPRFNRRLLRLLLIALVVLMPVRMAWSAAAGYCAHEAVVASSHFGHHAHAEAGADAQTPEDDAQRSGFSDPDCSACHAWSAHLAAWQRSAVSAPPDAFTAPPLQWALPSHHLPDIERPKWADAA
jgi:hypothetical protein